MIANRRGFHRVSGGRIARRHLRLAAFVGIIAVFNAALGSVAAEPPDKLMLPPQFRRLLPLHKELAAPKPGEWLAEHKETGQNYRQYLTSHPIKAERKRRTIYIQPIGDFTETQRRILSDTAEFMAIYFQLPIKQREDVPLKTVPSAARRKPSVLASEQLLTTFLLSDVLRPRLPQNGVVILGLTASDLWPGEGWNYVFGQASFSDRVGIWSINRYGNPETSDEAYRRCLLRTLKTASHETGHMFSMMHCTLYECNMCGSNHLPEADRRPLELCPHCLAKLCFATGADPLKRFSDLAAFYKSHGLEKEREFCEKSLRAIGKR